MVQAMEAVRSGRMGTNQAARAHNVPPTTLKDRLSGMEVSLVLNLTLLKGGGRTTLTRSWQDQKRSALLLRGHYIRKGGALIVLMVKGGGLGMWSTIPRYHYILVIRYRGFELMMELQLKCRSSVPVRADQKMEKAILSVCVVQFLYNCHVAM